ncbi:LruC domain-containing protein [Sphingobacterium corticibacterium]|uniref:LruC domain-containing protein n=1 Tax=Sphingobacterium corticibacterium TaxID=2484746 RepID=A0A4Q6XHM7_9SPHI|nr:LruC domain-containing protein [Sphingobacterium corticibacterium]RZF59431.1 LruC domain-containing protein [Sphingobacterium corticibacterium]
MNNFFRFLMFPFAGLIFLVSSCAKMDDLYKGTENQESTLFEEDVVLPEAFNWESSKAVDVRIAVDDNYGGRYFYRVELYDGDPKSASSNLLGAGVAKSGQDYVDKIMVPTAAKYIYVKTTSPVGIAAISMIEVANKNTVSVNKSASAGRANKMFATVASSTTGGSGSTMMMAATSTPSVTVPADAIPLDDNSPYVTNFWGQPAATTFVVKAGVTLTQSFYLNAGRSGMKVFVEGTWEVGTLPVGNDNGIYVMPGGVLKANTLAQNGQAFFENHGTMEIGNDLAITNPVMSKNTGRLVVGGTLDIPSGGSFYNEGSIQTKNLTPNANTTFTNNGDLTITNTLTIPAGGQFLNNGTASVNVLTASTNTGLIRNEGSLTVKSGTVTNATIEAACHTTFETLATMVAKIYVTAGSLLSITNLDAGGTHFNLASSSILDVAALAKFNSNASTIQSSGSEAAVARLKKVESVQSGQTGGIAYSGNVEIATSDYTTNGTNNIVYTVTSPARIVDYDKSTVVIPGTECNAGGNNDAGAGTDPDDQTTPEVSLGTYSYAFEDNWPSFGDYDMNDFVVDMDITKFQNTENKVTKVQLKAKLRSVGAAKRLAAAIQLDGVASNNVKGVTYSNSSIVGTNFNLSSNGTESGQTYAVVPITSDAHQAFGQSDVAFISTKDGQVAPVELTITVEFNTPLANFTYENLNVFIINFMQNKGGRNEVHLAGYKATDKINSSLVQAEVNSGLLSSIDQPFKSKKGYPWAISVPVSFDYPLEAKNIKDVFPNFKSWATSGGEEHQDWYIK